MIHRVASKAFSGLLVIRDRENLQSRLPLPASAKTMESSGLSSSSIVILQEQQIQLHISHLLLDSLLITPQLLLMPSMML
jgi:hypothetical protein